RIDLPRLDRFLRALPRTSSGRRIAHVLEFRDPSWYVADTFQLLEASGVSLCLHDKLGSAFDRVFVGPCAYVRFHGTSGRYHGSYADQDLGNWAHRLAEQVQDGRAVYAYFNNDPDATAVANALTLRTRLDRLI